MDEITTSFAHRISIPYKIVTISEMKIRLLNNNERQFLID